MHSLNQKNELKLLLKSYKNQIDELIEKKYGTSCDEMSLNKACYYALEGSAKRFRPCITLIVADLLKNDLDATYGALAVELFHTASLVADDLPSMDDDSERRKKPALHKIYGEGVALLSSYALIGEGYLCILKNKETLFGKLEDLDVRGDLAIGMLAQNNGLEGAPCGQMLDLYPPLINKKNLDLIFYRKTVLFFETAFVLGWLFGGGDLNKLDCVKKAAYHFGMAFQIYDDFCDLDQDRLKGKVINYPLSLGCEKSKVYLKGHTKECSLLLEKLELNGKHFQEMLNLIEAPL
ncbi:MAG: Farnesyl diphosphate synthase [Chlamydiae bacterium]|nr:Farnesyl diphosphate synthase [Chlamydiota bacterium]